MKWSIDEIAGYRKIFIFSFYIFLDKEALRLLLKNNYHQELQPAKAIEVSVYILGQ